MMRRGQFLVGLMGLLLPLGTVLNGADGGATYVVRRGDTLSAIARRHKLTVAQLKAANGLQSDLIRVGQRLRIPGAEDGEFSRLLDGVHFDRGRWKYIVAHHSATPYGNAAIYDRNHRRRGMANGLAYHFVIGNGRDSGDGEIEVGPRWLGQLAGGHVRSSEFNEHGIGICLVGNFEETRPSSRQIQALTGLVAWLGETLLAGNYRFTVHREVDRNHTVCPGRNFPVRDLKQRFRS